MREPVDGRVVGCGRGVWWRRGGVHLLCTTRALSRRTRTGPHDGRDRCAGPRLWPSPRYHAVLPRSDGCLAALGTVLRGVVSSGAWGVFSRVDLLSPRAVAVFAQAVLAVRNGLAERTGEVEVAGSRIPLTKCGLAATVGTFPGTLPLACRAAFRPVALAPPPLEPVLDVLLAAAGFVSSRSTARKLACFLAASPAGVEPGARLRQARAVIQARDANQPIARHELKNEEKKRYSSPSEARSGLYQHRFWQ